MMHIHEMKGCAPVPLAHYLKALGILRLVSEQIDDNARGWWDGERFKLAVRLNSKELERFFLDSYRPTPLIAPWNKGSGFYYQNDPGLLPLRNSISDRFEPFREAIRTALSLTAEMVEADDLTRKIKAESKLKGLSKVERAALRNSMDYKNRLATTEKRFNELKARVFTKCRASWRGPHLDWMEAAVVLDGNGHPGFPALLGTGGNDGRLDFTNNYMQRLNDLFDLASKEGRFRDEAVRWFENALWGVPTAGLQTGNAVGQYLPGKAGGANSTTGPTGDSLLNPADFVLMLEGSVVFTALSTRKFSRVSHARPAAPFAVPSYASGYPSAADSDESGRRGEQWMPLWHQPTTFLELKHLLGEGRAQLRKQTTGNDSLDMARSIANLGTARGIMEFQRYGYVERNGQSNIAIPLGRFRVPEKASPILDCLNDIDRYSWLNRLRQEAHSQHAPARLRQAENTLGNTLFAITQKANDPAGWQAALIALGDVEDLMGAGSGFAAGPVPPLRPEWVRAADDGSAEFRLALSFALQHSPFRKGGDAVRPEDGVRRHRLPMKGDRFATSGEGSGKRIDRRPDVVMAGQDAIQDSIALVWRRLIEASQTGNRCMPLAPAFRAHTDLADLSLLLSGGVDLVRTISLARALMALDRRQWARSMVRPNRPAKYGEYPDDAWLAIRLSLLPWALPNKSPIGTDPAIFRRLASGDAAASFDLARRRLQAAGFQVSVRCAAVFPEIARLWAAALAFPITPADALAIARRVDPNQESI